jgi:hypothetical protein
MISEEHEVWKAKCRTRIKELDAELAAVEEANGYI